MRKFAILSCALILLTATVDRALAQEQQQPAAQATAAVAVQPNVVLYESKSFVATSTREQHFESDTFALQPGQEKLPLTLVVKNGADEKVPFNWFRVNINGYLVASEKDLAGKREGAIDLTGKNFSSDESQDTVLIGNRPAQLLSAGNNSITAQVPADVQGGNAGVKVIVDSIASKPLGLLVSEVPPPVLVSTNYWMAPPGAYLTINGQNFGDDSSKMQVFFGGVQAQVVNASPTSATVIVPNWSYGPSQMNIPLYMVANGVRSANSMPFDIGPKYLGALPPIPGDSYSEAGSQASSQAGSQAGSQAEWHGITSPNANFGSSGSQASGGSFPPVIP